MLNFTYFNSKNRSFKSKNHKKSNKKTINNDKFTHKFLSCVSKNGNFNRKKFTFCYKSYDFIYRFLSLHFL